MSKVVSYQPRGFNPILSLCAALVFVHQRELQQGLAPPLGYRYKSLMRIYLLTAQVENTTQNRVVLLELFKKLSPGAKEAPSPVAPLVLEMPDGHEFLAAIFMSVPYLQARLEIPDIHAKHLPNSRSPFSRIWQRFPFGNNPTNSRLLMAAAFGLDAFPEFHGQLGSKNGKSIRLDHLTRSRRL